MHKRNLLAAAVALTAAVLGLVGCGSAGSGNTTDAKSLTTVTVIQGAQTLSYSAVYLAQSMGYFKDEGLNVNIITATSSAAAVQALVGGSANFGLVGTGDVLNAVSSKIPVRSVLTLTRRAGLVLTVSNQFLATHHVTPDSPLADRIAALRGAKIGLTAPGSAVGVMLKLLLQNEGHLNPNKDVTLVALSANNSAMEAALQHNTVDAIFISPPAGDEAVANGYGKALINLADGSDAEFNSISYQTVATSTGFLQAHKATVQAFGRALAKADAFLAASKNKAAQQIANVFPTIKPAVLASALAATYPTFPTTPAIDPAGIDGVITLYGSSLKSSDIAISVGP